MQTNSCLDLLLKLHAHNNVIIRVAVEQFNKIAAQPVSVEQLADAGYYLVCSLKTKQVNYLRKI